MERSDEGRYLAYMLRLWLVETGGGPVWLASLERVPGGERRSFGGLEGLLEFLREATAVEPRAGDEGRERR